MNKDINMADYCKNKDLLAEVIKSKKEGRTKQLESYFILMTKHIATKFQFNCDDDRKDSIQDALIALLLRWQGFDETKYTNAFAYYTEIIKRSYVMSYNKRNKHLVSLDELGF